MSRIPFEEIKNVALNTMIDIDKKKEVLDLYANYKVTSTVIPKTQTS